MSGIAFAKDYLFVWAVIAQTLLPYIYVIALIFSYVLFVAVRISFLFSPAGRLLRSKRRAKRFIKNAAVVTPDNRDLFFKSVIKPLPRPLQSDYERYTSGELNIDELLPKQTITEWEKIHIKLRLCLYNTAMLLFITFYAILAVASGDAITQTVIYGLIIVMSYLQGRLLLTLQLYRHKAKGDLAREQLLRLLKTALVRDKKTALPLSTQEKRVEELMELIEMV